VKLCWSSESAQRPTFSRISLVLGKLAESLGLDADPSSQKVRNAKRERDVKERFEERNVKREMRKERCEIEM
jgi:hypothetical protein